jgi:hypothetical protein
MTKGALLDLLERHRRADRVTVPLLKALAAGRETAPPALLAAGGGAALGVHRFPPTELRALRFVTPGSARRTLA